MDNQVTMEQAQSQEENGQPEGQPLNETLKNHSGLSGTPTFGFFTDSSAVVMFPIKVFLDHQELEEKIQEHLDNQFDR